jgi:hypothetical protein
MAVYGEMLLHFPEQFREFTYFDMIPLENAGYTVDPNFTPRTLIGILQNSTTMVKEGNGNIVTQANEFLWTANLLDMGKFVQFGATIFRIIPANDWVTEGGFTQYTIQRLVGDNGSPITQTWENGSTQI